MKHSVKLNVISSLKLMMSSIMNVFVYPCTDDNMTFFSISDGRRPDRGRTADSSEEWGYIFLRPGASMFYWFYRTTHADGYRNRPIVLWLQGGPGLSGTGIGNFLEFGPLDHNLEPRNTTWIQTVNVLLVDSPVHSGLSIADEESDIPGNITEISEDLIKVLTTFLEEHASFRTNPLYVFGQSYGGKMAAALGYYLHKGIQSGNIQCNLKGIAIGNGFVSPIDFVMSYSPLVYQLSLIDLAQHEILSDFASKAHREAENNDWAAADHHLDNLWDNLHEFVPEVNYLSTFAQYENSFS